MRLPRLAAVLAGSALRASWPLVLPFYGALAIASAVLFSRNGLRAADVTAAAAASRGFAAGLWLAWLAGASPIARALVRVPSTDLLRSLPLPRRWFWGTHLGLLLLAETPWFLLWSRGAGLLAGLGATAAAAGPVAGRGPPRRCAATWLRRATIISVWGRAFDMSRSCHPDRCACAVRAQ